MTDSPILKYAKAVWSRRAALCGVLTLAGHIILFSGALVNCHAGDQKASPMKKGETITYDIRKLKIKVGEASLVFHGPVTIGGRETIWLTFTAKGVKFSDKEEIYLDPDSYFPILIKRDLDIFGKKEKITEHYDAQKGRVRIVKIADGKTGEETIEGGARFDNIYGFIYRYRQSGQFQADETLHLHLPTSDVSFAIAQKTTFLLDDRHYDAYFLSSVPRKYKVWFDSGQKRIPLKIDGALGFGRTAMVLKGYYDPG